MTFVSRHDRSLGLCTKRLNYSNCNLNITGIIIYLAMPEGTRKHLQLMEARPFVPLINRLHFQPSAVSSGFLIGLHQYHRRLDHLEQLLWMKVSFSQTANKKSLLHKTMIFNQSSLREALHLYYVSRANLLHIGHPFNSKIFQFVSFWSERKKKKLLFLFPPNSDFRKRKKEKGS